MSWTPPEPRVGSKYKSGVYTKEIAGLVRADIKKELPKGVRATVRTDYYAGGSSIDIYLRAIGGESLQTAEYKQWHLACEASGWKMADLKTQPKQYTETTRKVLKALDDLLRAYHYDASDSMTDYYHVNFAAHVRVASEVERAEMEAAKLDPVALAEAAAKEATARAAAELVEWQKQEAEYQAYLLTEAGKKTTATIAKVVAAQEAKREPSSWENRISLLEVD